LDLQMRVGDVLSYESRAFAWQFCDEEYELVARLVRPRRHWWNGRITTTTSCSNDCGRSAHMTRP